MVQKVRGEGSVKALRGPKIRACLSRQNVRGHVEGGDLIHFSRIHRVIRCGNVKLPRALNPETNSGHPPVSFLEP
jgi:hypothetical protein